MSSVHVSDLMITLRGECAFPPASRPCSDRKHGRTCICWCRDKDELPRISRRAAATCIAAAHPSRNLRPRAALRPRSPMHSSAHIVRGVASRDYRRDPLGKSRPWPSRSRVPAVGAAAEAKRIAGSSRTANARSLGRRAPNSPSRSDRNSHQLGRRAPMLDKRHTVVEVHDLYHQCPGKEKILIEIIANPIPSLAPRATPHSLFRGPTDRGWTRDVGYRTHIVTDLGRKWRTWVPGDGLGSQVTDLGPKCRRAGRARLGSRLPADWVGGAAPQRVPARRQMLGREGAERKAGLTIWAAKDFEY
jgi:hypothetical protein